MTSVRVSAAFVTAGGHVATTPTDPAARVLNVAVKPRTESGLGVPWNRPWLSVIAGAFVPQVKATSATDVAPGSVATMVTIHWDWSPADGALVKNPGVAPVTQLCWPPFTCRHSFRFVSGAAPTT